LVFNAVVEEFFALSRFEDLTRGFIWLLEIEGCGRRRFLGVAEIGESYSHSPGGFGVLELGGGRDFLWDEGWR
jgi:hypothetical protein